MNSRPFKASPNALGVMIQSNSDNLFSKVLNANNEESLYKKAIDILIYLHDRNINQFSKNNLVENYSDEKLISESELFIEWYIKSHLNIRTFFKKAKNAPQ